MSIDEENIDEKIAILCIAYNNLGIELEHLKRVHLIYKLNKISRRDFNLIN